MNLSSTELQSALTYNRRRGYSVQQVALLQRVVGVLVDAKLGPATTLGVARWQESQGLVADGRVGPKTWLAVQSIACITPLPEKTSGPAVGCGLAAYDQRFAGHTPEEALDVAFDAAVSEGAEEIWYWSTEWLIDDMGNKGNAYSEPWLVAKEKPSTPLGAWVDDPVKVVKTQLYASRLVDMGFSLAGLMLNRSNTRESNVPWDLRYEIDDLGYIGELFAKTGIALEATCWPQPSKRQIDAMLDDLEKILPLLGTRRVGLDGEGNWTKDFLSGFSTMRVAARYLIDGLRALLGEGGKIVFSTFTYHLENSSGATLAPMTDLLIPQGYSVVHRDHETIGFDDMLGPRRHPRLAMARARAAAAAPTER